jgi:hypothetical protein
MKTRFKNISKLSLLAVIMLAVFGLQSCYKRNFTTPGSTDLFDNSKVVSTSIYGMVQDEAGDAVANATVKSGSYTTQTDDNGLFFFNNITSPSHASTVVVSKTGYFNGSRTLSVNANDKHSVKIMLMAKGTPQTFYANNGGTVTFAGGSSISFPANVIVSKSTGLPYNGQVYVFGKNIDPTTETSRSTMPGDLRGIGMYGGERVLESFGMMVAELYDVSGNELQIANTSSATLSQTIPAALAGRAKSSIPLWYYDEAKGMWIEEGSATLIGNKYEGSVKHFTYWNFDAQLPSIQVEMVIQDQNGNPIQGAWVTLHNANNVGAHGNTSANGWIGGPAEANAVLDLKIYPGYNNVCAGLYIPIYSAVITTAAANMNLGVITVNVGQNAACTFNATLHDCLGAPISNGALYIPELSLMLTPNALGQVSHSMLCVPPMPMSLYAYDLNNNVYGLSNFTLSPGVNNIGILSACGNIAPFLTINLTNMVTMASANTTFTAPTDVLNCSVQGINSYLSAYGVGGSVSMNVDGNTLGTFNVSYGYENGIGAFADSLTLTGINNVTYSAFPAFPGAVEGTFSLNFIGSPSGDAYTGTGSFRIPRNN